MADKRHQEAANATNAPKILKRERTSITTSQRTNTALSIFQVRYNHVTMDEVIQSLMKQVDPDIMDKADEIIRKEESLKESIREAAKIV